MTGWTTTDEELARAQERIEKLGRVAGRAYDVLKGIERNSLTVVQADSIHLLPELRAALRDAGYE